MNILIHSSVFHPSVGGMETVAKLLANEFSVNGLNVKVITETKADQTLAYPFQVLRQPTAKEIVKLVHWADIVFLQSISLKFIWLPLLLRKKIFVTHHTWYGDPTGGKTSWQGRLKILLCKRVINIAISDAIGLSLGAAYHKILNPVDIHFYLPTFHQAKNENLVFLGRLVKDKGCDILLNALLILRNRHNCILNLTVIGDGPERIGLESFINDHQLSDQVSFRGILTGDQLREELGVYNIMVVPSRWNEPYGVVAIEGMAAGCIVVGSQGGGLSEAIGHAGITFMNNNAEDLANCLLKAVNSPLPIIAEGIRLNHVQEHNPQIVAKKYIDLFLQIS